PGSVATSARIATRTAAHAVPRTTRARRGRLERDGSHRPNRRASSRGFAPALEARRRWGPAWFPASLDTARPSRPPRAAAPRTRLGRSLGRLPHVWLALFTLVATMTAISASPAHADPNPVVTENQQPGTGQWRLTKPGDDVKQQVKGYASATSVNLGDTVTF